MAAASCENYAPVASHGLVVVVDHFLGMVVGVTDAMQAFDKKENHYRPAFAMDNKGSLLCCHSSLDCLSFGASMAPFQSVGAHTTQLGYIENRGSNMLSLSATTDNPSSLSFESVRS